MIRFIILCLCVVNIPAHGQSVWAIDSSTVNFHIKNAGITVSGSFTGLQSEVKFNPKKLKKSSIVSSVDARTVNTGIRIRDKHLIKQEYFDAVANPRISMVSQSFQKQGENRFIGIFVITIKGVVDTISIPFTFTRQGDNGILSGSFEINRKVYNVGGSSIILADDVKIDLWVKGKINY